MHLLAAVATHEREGGAHGVGGSLGGTRRSNSSKVDERLGPRCQLNLRNGDSHAAGEETGAGACLARRADTERVLHTETQGCRSRSCARSHGERPFPPGASLAWPFLQPFVAEFAHTNTSALAAGTRPTFRCRRKCSRWRRQRGRGRRRIRSAQRLSSRSAAPCS